MTFQLKILGSNSATPAYGRHHTSQILLAGKHQFLIDCGESTQLQMQRFRVNNGRTNHIFISHLHGDHYLGLMGLIFTQHLMGRKKSLHIYGQKGLQDIITLQLKYSDTRLNYIICFHQLNPEAPETLFEDEQVIVTSFPLNHRIPCCGFLFREQPKPHRIRKDKLPEKMSLPAIHSLKRGEDYVNDEGNVQYRVSEMTLPPKKSRTYAYCSDTAFAESIMDQVKNVDLLYHEATFLNEKEKWALQTFHSTTRQAAELAVKAGVSQLLIGHFSARYKDLTPFLEEASNIFPNTLLAIEGETYSVPEK